MDVGVCNTDHLSAPLATSLIWHVGRVQCFQHSYEGHIVLEKTIQGDFLVLRTHRLCQGQGSFIELHLQEFATIGIARRSKIVDILQSGTALDKEACKNN